MIDWTHWHNEAFLVGGIILLGWLYALAIGPFRVRLAAGQPFPRTQAVRFYLALLCFYLAVGSPLDQIGERFLFSAHMVQHQVLMYPAALLFLLGLPEWLIRPATNAAALRPYWRVLTRPLVCGVLFVLCLSVWHVPILYDWALQNKTVHIVEHLTFFAASLLLWWPIASPSREFPPAPYATQMLFVFLVTAGMTPVFAYVTFSSEVLYPTYEFAPRITSLSPREDQVLGGTLMKLGGMLVSLATFGYSFYRWYRTSQSPDPPATDSASARPHAVSSGQS